MNLRYKIILQILFASLTTLAHAQDTQTPIEQLMSEEEIQQSGIDRLTNNELIFLNNWIQQRVINLNAAPRQTQQTDDLKNSQISNPSLAYEKAKKALNAPRVLKIKGNFKGWSGDTYFEMTNGEIWKQRTKSRYTVKLSEPDVRIYKNKLGFFVLEVIETGKKVGVKRIQR